MQIYGLSQGNVVDVGSAIEGGTRHKRGKEAWTIAKQDRQRRIGQEDQDRALQQDQARMKRLYAGLKAAEQNPGVLQAVARDYPEMAPQLGQLMQANDPNAFQQGLGQLRAQIEYQMGAVPQQQDPKLAKDAEGYQRYVTGPNAGQRAFPGVEIPEKADWLERLKAEDYMTRAREADARTYKEQQQAAERERKAAEVTQQNQQAWEAYDAGMTGVMNSLQNTWTGPVVGSGPAVTANQQIAEGAVAALAPILKQLFRSAGEGVFTDKDQELLLAMVPTRKTEPEARQAQVDLINQIVSAKLGLPAPQSSGGNQQQGPIATNPQTGEQVQWNGQQWVPINAQ